MSLRFSAVLFSCLFALIVSAPLENDVVEPIADPVNYRLPTIIVPSHYDLTFKPELNESAPNSFTFEGTAEITIRPTNATNTIILHSKNLNYTEMKYQRKNTATDTNLKKISQDDITDKWTFETTTNMAANDEYILKFKFIGKMEDDMHGFYRSSYLDSENKTQWIGSTQFQTHHARRAFPCFDEPNFKATFNVTIIRPKSMKSWSNTEIRTSTLSGEYVHDIYEETPKMSTYILAFIVSRFVENFDGKHGVIARPEYYTQTSYSADVGKKILKQLGIYLDMDYYTMGVNKMHHAAIPDFSAGAMENWGLLTYRERSLLYDPMYTSLSSQQSIAAVVAHEEAHMWFGDWTTCDWWSYTWLNEGFARYFQYFGTAMVEDKWDLDKQFVVAQLQSVMYMDSTNNTNPMSDENTNSPSDLSRMFNSISYNKGASIIRMIAHTMNETNFKQSLREYLKDHKYANTKPSDLLAAFQNNWPAASKEHSGAIFTSFTEQVGYPLVTFNVAANKRSFQITQKRFLLKSDDGSDANLQYTIPITYASNIENSFTNTSPKQFLKPGEPITVTTSSNITWLIGNIQETGYYRVNYDNSSWHQLHHTLMNSDKGGIPDISRAQIVDDLLNLARAKVIDYDLCFALLDYLASEIDYLPWRAAFNGLSFLEIRLGNDTRTFKHYMRRQLDKVFQQLGFLEKTNDTALDIYNRANVVSWICKNGDSDCNKQALTMFRAMDNVPLPKNLAAEIYCIAMREGIAGDYHNLMKKYNSTTVATEKTNILNNLGCVKDESLIKEHFNFVISDNVRRQDKSSALSTLYTSNNENVSPVFKLVTENYAKLADAMGSYSSVASIISSIASRFTEQQQLKDLEEFNKMSAVQNSFGESSMATLKAAEVTVKNNLAWDEQRLGDVRTNLDERSAGGSILQNGFAVATILIIAIVSVFVQ